MNKFDFYKVVLIKTNRKKLKKLDGKSGVVMGMAQSENGKYIYSVSIESEGISYSLHEKELISTGEKRKHSDFYDGSSIKVRVDPKTGKGRVEGINIIKS